MKKGDGMEYQEYLVKSGTYSLDQLAQLENYRGNVHSIFHRTMNLIDENSTLLTLSTDELDAAPQTVQLSNFFPNEWILQGMKVEGQKNGLLIDSKWYVNFQEMIPQVLEVPTFSFHPTLFAQLAVVSKQMLRKKKEAGTTTFEQQLVSRLEEAIMNFEQAVLMKNEKEINKRMNQLIGLGLGLTPSGDDYLTGFFLVTGMHDYPQLWLNKRLSIAFYQRETQTNMISQTQMALALKGQARARLLLLLKEVMQETTSNQLDKRVEEVLKIGSSSGADILRGMISGIKLTIQLGGKTK